MKPTNKLLPSDRTALAKLRLQEKMAAKKKQQQQAANNNDDDDATTSSANSSDSEEVVGQSSNKFGSLATLEENELSRNSNKKKNAAATSTPSLTTTANKKSKTDATANKKKEQQPAAKKASPKKQQQKEKEKVTTADEKKSTEEVSQQKEESPSLTLPKPKSNSNNDKENTNTKTMTSDDRNNNAISASGATDAKDLAEILSDDDENSTEAESAAAQAPEDPSMVDAYDEFNLVEHDRNNKDQKEENTTSEQQQQEWQDHGTLLSEERKNEKEPPQHFDYFLLIDFECTCDEHPGFDNEIIEMPALLYDTKQLKVVAEFHTYIKPLRNPILTPFCHQLTGIRQDQVEDAPCYDEALKSLVTWVQDTLLELTGSRRTDGSRLCVATDGPCDLEVFGYLFMHIRDGFNFPNFFQRYIDVKQVYRDEYGDGKYYKIKDMLARFGLKFQGNQHSGIDDTRNLGTIVSNMIRRGTVFEEVYYVNNVSGRRRVPAYIWNRAKLTVRRAQDRRRVGKGPLMADRCRQGLLGLSEKEIAIRTGSGVGAGGAGGFYSLESISAMLKRFALVRIKVRASEFSSAPSTALLVLMLCVFVASFFVNIKENGLMRM